ncbi:MAG: type II toxin-antitoxin system Phd/YefM family antitoxin [Anaerolineae bacterium]|nr:type II toxin-antitoxin system Phd/YefM family antitoxin [Anaerolineae bacterium]
MTKSFTYTETRQNLSAVLAQAEKDGEVLITQRSGKKFVLKLIKSNKSPLDVPGIDAGLNREEILDFIKDGREKDVNERRLTYKE